jgi:hypothetical protein
METILQQFYKDLKLSASNDAEMEEQRWQHQINNKISLEYNYEVAQTLFEFSNNVSICNHNGVKLIPPNFDIIISIDTIVYYENVNALWFCYSTKLNIMLLCFTSTYTNSLYLVDANYLHQDPKGTVNNTCDKFMIHGGFLNFYQSFRDKMFNTIKLYYNNETQLIISGFSLGGAISTLAALDLCDYQNNTTNLVHYSFASPRIFNIVGANHYNSFNIYSYRIYNDSDIVPSLPFPIMISSIKTNSLVIQDFMHVGTNANTNVIYFNNNMDNYYNNHILAYLKFFKLI